MNLLILLDKLERLLESSTQVPLTSRSIINTEQALDLLGKIRDALPENVKQAEIVAKEKEKIIQEGKGEAERVILEAQEYVSRLLEESEIISKAKYEAERIIASAEMEDAQKYARNVLHSLQEALNKAIKVVEEGEKQLD